IAPRPETREGKRIGVSQIGGGPIVLTKDAVIEVQKISPNRPMLLRALEFSVPREQAVEFGRARLRITWDGLPHSSVDAPVALFFGAGTLYNRDNREYLVKAFPMNVRYDSNRV